MQNAKSQLSQPLALSKNNSRLPFQKAIEVIFQCLPTSASGINGIFVKAFKAQEGSIRKALENDPELQKELDQVFTLARDRLNEIYPPSVKIEWSGALARAKRDYHQLDNSRSFGDHVSRLGVIPANLCLSSIILSLGVRALKLPSGNIIIWGS